MTNMDMLDSELENILSSMNDYVPLNDLDYKPVVQNTLVSCTQSCNVSNTNSNATNQTFSANIALNSAQLNEKTLRNDEDSSNASFSCLSEPAMRSNTCEANFLAIKRNSADTNII